MNWLERFFNWLEQIRPFPKVSKAEKIVFPLENGQGHALFLHKVDHDRESSSVIKDLFHQDDGHYPLQPKSFLPEGYVYMMVMQDDGSAYCRCMYKLDKPIIAMEMADTATC